LLFKRVQNLSHLNLIERNLIDFVLEQIHNVIYVNIVNFLLFVVFELFRVKDVEQRFLLRFRLLNLLLLLFVFFIVALLGAFFGLFGGVLMLVETLQNEFFEVIDFDGLANFESVLILQTLEHDQLHSLVFKDF